MRQPNFQPRPSRPQRGVIRWILLFIHVLPFIALIFMYPNLAEMTPEVFASNLVWVGILVWAMVLLLHLLLVILLELRESIIFAARERRRRNRYKAMRDENRERQRAFVRELETRVYDENDLEPLSGQ